MEVKECNSRAGVYKVQTFGTTQVHETTEKNIDMGKILYIIISNSISGYRLGNDLKASK
jgi:hypothetical protein